MSGSYTKIIRRQVSSSVDTKKPMLTQLIFVKDIILCILGVIIR